MPLLTDDETFIKNWESVTFEGLGFDPNDKTKFYSDKGERMRSKSEVFIANALLKHNIPYKYECPMLLDNGTVRYPDFTILCVRERIIKIWEHLGRMNDMDYVRRNVIKLEEYKSNGYVIGKDLLLSYEFSDNLLGNKEIEEILNQI